MKVLFFMIHPGYARNFEWTLRELLEGGHEVHVALEKEEKDAGSGRLLSSLGDQYPGLTVALAPAPQRRDASSLARAVRLGLDYLRYLEPAFAGATKLRERGGRRVPGGIRRAVERLARRRPSAIGLLRRVGEALHDRLPVSQHLIGYVRDQSPDVAVLTPLLALASNQPEYLRVCNALGVPTCVPIASWDNLTNKGVIHGHPDAVAVWNEAQRAEAVELHRMAPERVHVTGAVAYDHWFDWTPNRTREQLCEEVGLDPRRPFALYVGSSPFIAPDEAPIALRWVRALRDAGLEDLQVLVRPHPQNPMRGVARDYLEQLDGVAVYPPKGVNPMDAASRADYFDSIHHCAAVLGINTSAMVEAAILDRPVHTLLESELAPTQTGTLHFHHLLPENGGVVQAARTREELAAALARSLETGVDADANRAFVERFLRPLGRDRAGSPLLVETIASLAGRRAAPAPQPSRALAAAVGGFGRAYIDLRDRWVEIRRAQARMRRRLFKFLGRPAIPRFITERRLARETRYLRERVETAAEPRGPVIAGPFVGEVGFELLYWLPFLRWVVREYPELGERLIVCSRGGTRSWYDGIASEYVDVLDLIDPDELNKRRKRLKQRGGASALDNELHGAVRARLALGDSSLLHTSPLWESYHRSIKTNQDAYAGALRAAGANGTIAGLNALYEPLAPPPAGELESLLPDEFVAVRFYFRPSFVDSGANREFAQAVVGSLAERWPVVLLNNRMELDDHRDLDLGAAEVVRLHERMTPANNLHVQSVAISRARAFVGTYGGLSYLAPHYGVPSRGVFDDDSHIWPWHQRLAQRLFERPGFAPLEVRSVGEFGEGERAAELVSALTGR